jgi:WhiB family transcriptional regulator, redox-sensing transcriptional regulator
MGRPMADVGSTIAELGARLAFDDEARRWMLEARCLDADPEAFFPEKGGSTREAKRICAVCPVRQDCLSYALDNDERFGIWGGMSERERRRLKRLSA